VILLAAILGIILALFDLAAQWARPNVEPYLCAIIA